MFGRLQDLVAVETCRAREWAEVKLKRGRDIASLEYLDTQYKYAARPLGATTLIMKSLINKSILNKSIIIIKSIIKSTISSYTLG